jgi:hypothetical protein
MNKLDERERAILKMALSYAYANIDDFREAFPYVSEAEPDGDKCIIDRTIIDPPKGEDVDALSKKMGLGSIF